MGRRRVKMTQPSDIRGEWVKRSDASWSDRAGDRTAALIGTPLRIALVVVLLVVRAVAKWASHGSSSAYCKSSSADALR